MRHEACRHAGYVRIAEDKDRRTRLSLDWTRTRTAMAMTGHILFESTL